MCFCFTRRSPQLHVASALLPVDLLPFTASLPRRREAEDGLHKRQSLPPVPFYLFILQQHLYFNFSMLHSSDWQKFDQLDWFKSLMIKEVNGNAETVTNVFVLFSGNIHFFLQKTYLCFHSSRLSWLDCWTVQGVPHLQSTVAGIGSSSQNEMKQVWKMDGFLQIKSECNTLL